MSKNFRRPSCFTVVGGGRESLVFTGIVRDMQLRLKGTAKSVRSHVLIVEDLDNIVDFIFNARFVQKYFHLLFDNVKSYFGGIFSWKKKQSKGTSFLMAIW